MKIALILGTVRTGRQSEKVFRVMSSMLKQKNVEVIELDLKALDLPRFEGENYAHAGVAKLTSSIKAADGVIIVTPEYNHGFPGVLKDAIDFCRQREIMNKPLAVVGVSNGAFGGIRATKELQGIWLGTKGIVLPQYLPTPMVEEFDEKNLPAMWLEKANVFVDGALGLIEKLSA